MSNKSWELCLFEQINAGAEKDKYKETKYILVAQKQGFGMSRSITIPVSYTHLTLPTKLEV